MYVDCTTLTARLYRVQTLLERRQRKGQPARLTELGKLRQEQQHRTARRSRWPIYYASFRTFSHLIYCTRKQKREREEIIRRTFRFGSALRTYLCRYICTYIYTIRMRTDDLVFATMYSKLCINVMDKYPLEIGAMHKIRMEHLIAKIFFRLRYLCTYICT